MMAHERIGCEQGKRIGPCSCSWSPRVWENGEPWRELSIRSKFRQDSKKNEGQLGKSFAEKMGFEGTTELIGRTLFIIPLILHAKRQRLTTVPFLLDSNFLPGRRSWTDATQTLLANLGANQPFFQHIFPISVGKKTSNASLFRYWMSYYRKIWFWF